MELLRLQQADISAEIVGIAFNRRRQCRNYSCRERSAGRHEMWMGARGREHMGCSKFAPFLHTESLNIRRAPMFLTSPPKGSIMRYEKFRISAVLHKARLLAIPTSGRFLALNFLPASGQSSSAQQPAMPLPEKKLPESGRTKWLLRHLDSSRELSLKLSADAFAWRNRCQLLVALLAVVVFGAAAQPSPSFGETLIESPGIARSIELPPLPSEFRDLGNITPLSYEQLTLSNGLRVFLLEDHELGLVGGELLVRGGGKLEPADKVGLAAMSSIVQRSGGSSAHPAEELDSQLEVMAARIEASSSVSEMTVGFRCLTEDLETVFSLFSEVVQEPLMPQDKLEFTRSQFLGGIARRSDDAAGIAAREFEKLLYGSESVYARVPEIATVSAVTKDDLQSFHRQNFRPERGVLGIWGDFDAKTVKKMVEEQFGRWTVEGQGVNPVPETVGPALERGYSASPPSIFVIDRPGLTQGYVRMGEFGTTLADPDVFSLDVLNGVLNGFGGLLFDEVRSREGLAYSVSGGWSPAVEHRGAFIAGGETRVQAIPQFVQAVKRVLNKVTTELADADTLAKAKEAALNSFVFNFTDSGAQLVRVMSYELFDIDQDFLFKYKKGVEATTASDVLRAAQRHLHVDEQPILIVTDAKQLAPLSSVIHVPVVSLRPNYASSEGTAIK